MPILQGATTLDEYRQYIEKDPALERRFQQVRSCWVGLVGAEGLYMWTPRTWPTSMPPPAFHPLFSFLPQVYVDQPSVPDTISILRGLRERYELHHGVKISDSALVGGRGQDL